MAWSSDKMAQEGASVVGKMALQDNVVVGQHEGRTGEWSDHLQGRIGEVDVQ